MTKLGVSMWGFRGVAASLGVTAVSALGLLACGGTAAPAEAPPSAAASAEPSKAPPPQDPAEESVAPDKQSLAQGAAAQIASHWATERAAKEKIELAVRIRVEDMSAVVVGKGDGAYTLTGVDAVNTKPDVVVDLTQEQAKAIAEGTATLKGLRAAGQVKTDNEQGLDWFLGYIDLPK